MSDFSYRYVIIGSGFGGMCAAIKLREMGEEDFVILERAGSVGGTWRDNHYPGCACDVPAVLYSLSFAQNPDWSRKYPTQPELYAYSKDIAERFGLMPRIRFHHNVTMSEYDEAEKCWRVHTEQGIFSARYLISACGGLSEPAWPAIPGMETFAGTAFHSAQWNHEYDLRGKRVAVIGTGASAIQVVPAIQPEVRELLLFQRTPAWVLPRRDREIRPWEKALRRTPLRNIPRWLLYWFSEAFAIYLTCYPRAHRWLEPLALRHLNSQIADPVLRAKLKPNYRLGCKRALTSDDYYPAVGSPNVSVISDRIESITPGGLRTSNGREHTVDAIIYCTGFHATDNPIAHRVRGRGGKSLAEVWRDGEEAYRGTVIHGFPNLFLIAGPNTGIGHTSFIFIIESQVRYIMACLRMANRKRLERLEVRADVQDGFNRRVQDRMQGTVWASGCKSWYMNASGKNTTLWPGFTFELWWKLRRANPTDFETSAT